MKKIIEIILVVTLLGLSISHGYFSSNKLAGAGDLYNSMNFAMILLAIYYLTISKDRYGRMIQLAMIIGLISTLMYVLIWPGGFLKSLTNVSMIAGAMIFLNSKSIDQRPKKDKLILQGIIACLFIYSSFTLSSYRLVFIIGQYFCFVILALILIYFIFRKKKEYVFDPNLKTFLFYSSMTVIPELSKFIF